MRFRTRRTLSLPLAVSFNTTPVRYSVVQHNPSQVQCRSTQPQSGTVSFNTTPVRYSVFQHNPSQVQCISTQPQSGTVSFNTTPVRYSVFQHNPSQVQCCSIKPMCTVYSSTTSVRPQAQCKYQVIKFSKTHKIVEKIPNKYLYLILIKQN